MTNRKRQRAGLAVLAYLLIIEMIFGTGFYGATAATEDKETEKIQENIEKIEDKIERERREKLLLEKDLGKIQQSLTATQQEIAATRGKVKEANDVIERKESELELLENNVAAKRALLESLIRELYYAGETPLIARMLGEQTLSESIENIDHLQLVQAKISGTIDEIRTSRELVEVEKEKIEELKKTQEERLSDKVDEHSELVVDKRDTLGDISEKNATIGELQEKLAKLKNNLSDMLDEEYNAKDIEDAANFAAKVTGVRKDFLMGMLVVESDLGRYTGGCTYQQVESGAEAAYKKGKLGKTAWATFQRRRDTFKSITKELGLDYKKQKVSCNPSSYAGTGGAMGVPQFMPDTWVGYKSQIASVTGHKPPSPWNLTDGVVAMAIKLAKVPGVTAKQKAAEKNASKIYLSGSTSASYNWYADKVQYWADNYERLLDN